jgi:hypothetical protein
MIQAAARQPAASPARAPEAASRPSTAAPAAAGRGALPAGLAGAGGPPSRWSLGAPNAAAEREAETAAERIGRGQRAGPMSAGGGDAVVRGDGATAGAGPVPQPATQALDGLSSGGGQPLSAPQMAFFGDAFSGPGRSSEAVRRSLAPVRVHTDTRAATVLEHTGAAAANVGAHVMSRPSDYSPSSPDGGPHFPHEIAHALQPGGLARDGEVRRIIRDKSGRGVNAPAWKGHTLKDGQLAELRALYRILEAEDTTFKFVDRTNQQIKKALEDYVTGGGKAQNFLSTTTERIEREAERNSDLSNNWLLKTDNHAGNYASFFTLHFDRLRDLEAGLTTPSQGIQDHYNQNKTQIKNLLGTADSSRASPETMVRLNKLLTDYHTYLNDKLVADGQPSRRVNMTLPKFGPFKTYTNDQSVAENHIGSSASITFTPHSSLAKGSSSDKANASVSGALWEPFLDSRRDGVNVLYVRGHLLNDNLSGPELPLNLVPLTYQAQELYGSANAQHLASVEAGLKTAVQAMFGRRGQMSALDLSILRNEISELTYTVTADYTRESEDARASLKSQAVAGVMEFGDQVASKVGSSGTGPSSAPALDARDPVAVSNALGANSGITVTPARRPNMTQGLTAIGGASGSLKNTYDLMVENAGLWAYDEEYVPRRLKTEIFTSKYNYDESSDSLTSTPSSEPKTDYIPNRIVNVLSKYKYERKTRAVQLRGLAKRAMATLPSSQPQTPSAPVVNGGAPQGVQTTPPQPTGAVNSGGLQPQTGLQTPSSPSPPVPTTSLPGPKSPPPPPPPPPPQQTTLSPHIPIRSGPTPSVSSPKAPSPTRAPQSPQPQQPPTGALAGLGTGLFGNNGAPLRFDQMDASGKPITPQYYTQPYNPRPPNGGVVNSSSSPLVQQTQSSSTTQFGQGYSGGSLSPSMTLPLDPYGAFGASFLDDAVRWQLQLQIAQAALQASERQRQQQQSVQTPVQPVFTQQTPVQPTLLTSPPIHTPPQQYRPPQPQSPQPVLVQSTPSQPVSQPARYPLPGAWTYPPPQHHQPQPPQSGYVQPAPSQPVMQPARYPLPGDPGPGQQQFSAPTPVRQAFYPPTPTTPHQGGGARGSGVARPTPSQPRNPRPRTDDDAARQDKRYRGGYSDEDLAVLAFNVADEEFRVANIVPTQDARLTRAGVIFAELQAERDELNNQDNAKRFRKGPRDDSGNGGGGFGSGGSGFGSGGGGFGFGGGGFNFNGGTGVF